MAVVIIPQPGSGRVPQRRARWPSRSLVHGRPPVEDRAKCTALAEWARAVPDSPAVLTANAEEDTHMLAVNTSIGFEPAWWSGAWQKHV
ncbi:hypothetical protein ACIPJ2_09675 [Curtobacterium sp. NPDC090217]|uniref:hypothetical protein n=1 Tax=Curtobacterium sp. NPDC090217 TaxID=3363970 RepID=UPI0037FC79E6